MSHFAIRSVDHLEEMIHRYLQQRDFDSALQVIQDVVIQIMHCPSNTASLFSSPYLDGLCQKIGKEIYKEKGLESAKVNDHPKSQTVIYIVSKLYLSGGHSGIIEDCIRLQPSQKHMILITDILPESSKEQIKARFSALPVDLIWAPSISLTEKVIWLVHQIIHYQPKIIFLLQHHHDSVAIAALQPQLHPWVIFYHHGDHQLSLGVHVSHFLHVDPHPMGFHHCREKLGVKGNIYWPLIAMDHGHRSAEQAFMKNGRLKTCSSGSEAKFESHAYLYRYDDVIPQVIKSTRGVHIHIGPLSSPNLNKIYQRLEEEGLERHQFIHIPWVASVWRALIQEQVDLYIPSFPFGGGKACIEVMGSGTPIATHQSYISQFHGGECLVYPEGFRWRKPQQLFLYVKTLTPDFLAEQSKCARRYYERYYHPQFLKEELKKNPSEMKGVVCPPLSPFQPDDLQIGLDRTINYQQQLHVQAQLQAVLDSDSWRITAPLRAMKSYYMKLKELIFN
jgi:hypothetical protein